MEFETVLQSDLTKPVQVKQLTGNLFTGDNGGNKITVEVFDNGEPAALSGGVTGYVIREDKKTVVISGTRDGNKASIVLPASAYAVEGQVSIVVKASSMTVGACTAYVYRTTTNKIIDPGSVVPDISELLAYIEDCIAATEDAEEATAATIAAIEGAENVNAAISKTDNVVTITVTNRNGVDTSVTMTEYAVATTTETAEIITEYEGVS